MAKKKSGSFQREKQRQMKNVDIMLTEVLEKQLKALKNVRAKPDNDTPEISNWSKSEVGKFYRPIKKQVTLRLDADTLFWFKQQSNKYQTLINAACREYMTRHHHE